MNRDRAYLVEPKERDRLLKNTLNTGDDRVRNHAILRLLFGSPMRLIELARLNTNEVCDREGKLLDLSHFRIKKEVSFNGKERYFPIVDKAILKAVQKWIDWRIANKWGVTSTGYIDLSTKLFLRSKGEEFKVYTKLDKGTPRTSCETLNRLVRGLFDKNGIEGNIESPLRTWTILMRRRGADIKGLWALRGDNNIDAVKRTVEKDPIRLSMMVENAF